MLPPFNERLAAIEKSLGKLNTQDWEAAKQAFMEAGSEYRQLEAEHRQICLNLEADRKALIAPDRYEERHPLVKAKDAELAQARSVQVAVLAQAEPVLAAALKKADFADKFQHDGLQQQIVAKQRLHDDERELGMAELNPQLIKLREEIGKLKQQQTRYAAGAARASSGKATPLPDMLKISGAGLIGYPEKLLKPGASLVIPIKGIETRWRWCPAGKFKMGSPKNEEGRSDNEDQVDVTLSQGLWMLETPVTQGLWTAVGGRSLDWSGYGKCPQHPVYNVNHDVSVEFIGQLNGLMKSIPEATGLLIRLPTEAECEHACRAGTTSRFYWGDDEGRLGDYAWHGGNSGSATHPVGQKKENAWGLKDMLGLASEWVADWYGSKLAGGTDPQGPSTGSNRWYRGGSWYDSNVGFFCVRRAAAGTRPRAGSTTWAFAWPQFQASSRRQSSSSSEARNGARRETFNRAPLGSDFRWHGAVSNALSSGSQPSGRHLLGTLFRWAAAAQKRFPEGRG